MKGLRFFSRSLMACMILLLCSLQGLAAQETTEAEEAPRCGIGVYGSATWGSDGMRLMPGLQLLFWKVPVGIRLLSQGETIQAGLSADYLFLDLKLAATDFAWYLGAGLDGDFDWTMGGTLQWAVRARALTGFRYRFTPTFEPFAQAVGGLGIGFDNMSPGFSWKVGLELGFRALL